MEINKRHFPKMMQDNDETFLAHLEGVINSVDELCSLEIIKLPHSYSFRIATSLPKYNNMLIEEILKLHSLFKIRINMGKSIKTSGTIFFEVMLGD